MRVGIVSIVQRSNTFASTVGALPLAERTPSEGALPWPFASDTFRPERDVQLVELLTVSPTAGGVIPRPTFEHILDHVCRAIETNGPFDAVLILASGTMRVTQESGEYSLVTTLSERFPELSIGCVFDHVAQFPLDLIERIPVVIGPHAWPAVDLPQRVARAIELLRLSCERTRPLQAIARRLPLLLPLAAQRTDIPPFATLPHTLAALERRETVLAATVFAGFPYADVPEAGASIVLVGSGTRSQLEALADDLASHVLRLAENLPLLHETIEEVLHRALAAGAGPILILDTGDAPEAGAPGEGTAALWAALDLGLRRALLVGIVDPEVVDLAKACGVGGELVCELGGRHDHRHGFPIPVRGTVRRLGIGRFRRRSPLFTHWEVDAGHSAWLELRGRHGAVIDVIVTSKPVAFDDVTLAAALGVDLAADPVVILKSTLDAVAAYGQLPLAPTGRGERVSRVLTAVTPGITTPDLAFFDYHHVPRPIWPLAGD